MVNCELSVDTDERTECMALERKWYWKMIREGKCGTKECPFYKVRDDE